MADTAGSEWSRLRPARSTYELLANAWLAEPDRLAAIDLPSGDPNDGDLRLTRRDMLDRIHRAANLFASLGVGPQDAVATLLPSCPETLAILYGAQAAGIAAPLNPLLRVAELEHLIRLAGSKVLVTSCDPAHEIWDKAVDLARRIPGLKLLATGPTTDTGIESFEAASAACLSTHLAFRREIAPEDIAAYIHTGGTTGLPKLACITHDNLIFGAWSQSQVWGFGEGDVILSALPLFHVSGLATLATVPLASGAAVLFLSPTGFRNPKIVENFWGIVDRYRGSFTAFVPTIAATLTGIPLGTADVSSLRTIMVGGSAAPVDTLRRLKALLPSRIVTTFGQTECLVGTGNRPGDEITPLSSGPAMPLMQVAIRNHDQFVEAGTTGEIVLKGPAVFGGYKGRPSMEGFTGDGWLLTGDLGWMDEQGCLFVTGRSKDVIIRSGHNIDPRAIEEAGAAHPAVSACAAVGAPDRYAGEVPVLYLSLRNGATADADEIARFVADNVPERPAAPRAVYILPSLPVTAVGKIYKPALRLDAAERIARRELGEFFAENAIASLQAHTDDRRGIVVEIVLAQGQDRASLSARIEQSLAGLLLHPHIVQAEKAV